MYKKMLVLLDGSELAEVVFNYAQELSGRLNLDLELLHVCAPNEAEQLPMRRAYIERMAETLCTAAEQIRSSTASDSVESCIVARGTVVVGYPAEEILKYVENNHADLIMMSTHGHSGVREWGIGGVASKVLHASKVPVWLVPSELRDEIVADTLPRRALVIPLSGSKMSEAAIPHALNMAIQRGADTDIVLLSVLDSESITLTRAQVKEMEKAREALQEYLNAVAQVIEANGFAVRTEVLVGEPADAIIEYLKANPPQLLCMATSGKTRLSRLVFGSVTENVINLIKKTPMLLVSGAPPED